jgi:transcriptional regulator
MKEADMLIHPWDAATGSAEWQDWLASTGRFGILAPGNPARAPLMLPTHFTLAGDELPPEASADRPSQPSTSAMPV